MAVGSWVLAATVGSVQCSKHGPHCPPHGCFRPACPLQLPGLSSLPTIPGPEPISLWGSLLVRLAPFLGWPWAWRACSSGGHQEALVPISTFLAETTFAVS